MPAKSRFKSIALFLGGFATACILAALLFWSQGVQADDYGCMRTDLDAKAYQGMLGTDNTVTIQYALPQCWFDAGYHADSAYIYDTNYLRVKYKK